MIKDEWKKYLRIGITVFVLFLLVYYWKMIENFGIAVLYAMTPLIGGFVTAYIVNLPLGWFERHLFGHPKSKFLKSIKRPVCILLSFLAMATVIFIVITLILPELMLCFDLLIKELPPVIEDMYKNLDDQFGISKLFADQIQQNFGENTNWRSLVEKAISFVTTGLGGVMGSIFTIVSSIFSTVVNIFISLILSVYMLAEKERLIAGVSKVTKVYVKPAVKNWLDNVVNVVNGCFRSFFVGQCTEAVILGVLCMIGMNIFGFPYATMIGTLIGFTALIPVAGAYIGAGIGAFMVFTAGSWLETLLFIVFILVLQQLEGNLIYPKVVGDSIGLPGIGVLAAVFVCGSAMGIPGMMIGVPITAAVYKLVKQDVEEKEEAREMPESASDNSPVSAEDAEIVSEE